MLPQQVGHAGGRLLAAMFRVPKFVLIAVPQQRLIVARHPARNS